MSHPDLDLGRSPVLPFDNDSLTTVAGAVAVLAVAFFNDHFINYSVDMEKDEGLQLSDRWEVTAYPSLLFFTPDGKMIMKKIGYVDGKHLVEFGEQALIKK